MPRFPRSTFTYCLCCCSLVLTTLAEAAQTPATVTLGNLLQTYDGTPKSPSVATQPPLLPTQVVYRNLSPTAPAPVSEVVYNDTPNPLLFNYQSYGFQANQLTALGNLIQLGGTARKLASCDVILSNYAHASEWPVLAASNPAGFTHPITIALYEVTSTNEIIPLTEGTQNILIPWVPTTKPDGSAYTNAGTAFRATISFPSEIILPERVLVMVTFNTESYGFAPIGVSGPYNFLNVSLKSTTNVTPVGSDVNPDVILQIKGMRTPTYVNTWYYPSTGYATSGSAPMIRLNALSSETITPPANAGTWQATAKISNSDYLGTSSNTFTIQPAPATVQLGELTQIIDGSPKPVTIATDPPNLSVSATYSSAAYPSSPTAPHDLGLYTVQAQITNPNYLGSANGQLSLIGHNLSSWLSPWVVNNQIPANATGSNDDPDLDSIPNLLEYALALDPSTSNHGLSNSGMPEAQYSSGQLSLIYRKNLAATDLEFQVESTTQPGTPENWLPAVTTNEVISTIGVVQTIRASIPTLPGDLRRFVRLKVTLQDPY